MVSLTHFDGTRVPYKVPCQMFTSIKCKLYEYIKTCWNGGVAPEQARMVLPQSTMTEWWWSGSLDAFADMCKLRLKDDTQYESRLVAQMIDKEMSHMFPVSWAALVKGENDE
jgi:thymidylate synthase ThyX